MSILNSDFNQLDKDSKILLKAELFKYTDSYTRVAYQLDQSTEENLMYGTSHINVSNRGTYYKIFGMESGNIISSRSLSYEQAKREFNTSALCECSGNYDVFRIMICNGYQGIPTEFIHIDLLNITNRIHGVIDRRSYLINIADPDKELNDRVTSNYIDRTLLNPYKRLNNF